MRRVGLSLIGNLPVRTAVAHVRAAEAAGFESFWMHETYYQRDAFSFLAALACQVERIGLATGCVGPFTRHPAVLAMSLATLAETSPGPVILGLGTGFVGRLDEMGIERPRLARGVEEAMAICRALWAGETASLDGRRFRVDGVRLSFPPARRIPIYVAGWGPLMLNLCGRVGDGYLARPVESPARVARWVDAIGEAARGAGRDLEEIDVAAYILCAADDDEAEARAAARHDPFLLYQLSVSDAVDEDLRRRLARDLRAGDLEAASRNVGEGLLDEFTACGSPSGIADRLARFVEAGVDLPVVQPLRTEPGAIAAVLEAGRLYAAAAALR